MLAPWAPGRGSPPPPAGEGPPERTFIDRLEALSAPKPRRVPHPRQPFTAVGCTPPLPVSANSNTGVLEGIEAVRGPQAPSPPSPPDVPAPAASPPARPSATATPAAMASVWKIVAYYCLPVPLILFSLLSIPLPK